MRQKHKNVTCITIIAVKAVSHVSMVTSARVQSLVIATSGKSMAVMNVPATFIQVWWPKKGQLTLELTSQNQKKSHLPTKCAHTQVNFYVYQIIKRNTISLRDN